MNQSDLVGAHHGRLGRVASSPRRDRPRGQAARPSELWLVPSLVTLCRLPLALLFAGSLPTPALALAVLTTAAATDVLDGFLARRLNLVTEMGTLLDPIVDKAFAAVTIAALVWAELVSLDEVWKLCTRELGELPIVGWWLTAHGRDAWRRDPPRASLLGKLATCLQFAAMTAAVHRHPARDWLLWAAAIGGMLAALGYGARTLARRARSKTAWRGA